MTFSPCHSFGLRWCPTTICQDSQISFSWCSNHLTRWIMFRQLAFSRPSSYAFCAWPPWNAANWHLSYLVSSNRRCLIFWWLHYWFPWLLPEFQVATPEWNPVFWDATFARALRHHQAFWWLWTASSKQFSSPFWQPSTQQWSLAEGPHLAPSGRRFFPFSPLCFLVFLLSSFVLEIPIFVIVLRSAVIPQVFTALGSP